MGAIDFRVGGRIFATLASVKEGLGDLILTPEIQAEFVADAPELFVPVTGGWGPLPIHRPPRSVHGGDVRPQFAPARKTEFAGDYELCVGQLEIACAGAAPGTNKILGSLTLLFQIDAEGRVPVAGSGHGASPFICLRPHQTKEDV